MRAFFLVSVLLSAVIAGFAVAPDSPPSRQAKAKHASAGIPVAFVENRGQWPEEVLFASVQGRATTVLTRDRISLFLRDGSLEKPARREVTLRWSGGAGEALLRTERSTDTAYNFLVGNDQSRWRTGVSGYSSVRYECLYDGVDLVVREAGSSLRYDLELAPRSDLEQITFDLEGVDSLRLDPSGHLIFETAIGEISQSAPVAWQTGLDGSRQPVECGFRILGPHSYGFHASGLDPELALTIDPTFDLSDYATYLPGSSGTRMTVGGDGAIYVAGHASSIPAGLAAFSLPGSDTSPDSNDTVAFLVKLDPDLNPGQAGGSLVYLTLFGGSSGESVQGIALGPMDSAAFVYGHTRSSDFPTSGTAAQGFLNGGFRNAFVTALDSGTGSMLVYSTYLGGPVDTIATRNCIAVDDLGRAYVAGQARGGFPGNPVLYGNPGLSGSGRDDDDLFVAALDPTGSQVLGSVLIGGVGFDRARGMTRDAAGNIYVAGFTGQLWQETAGDYFPTTPGAFKEEPEELTTTTGKGKKQQTTVQEDIDAFLVRLDATLSLEYSTLMGGPGEDLGGYGIDASSAGLVAVVGDTESEDFLPISADPFRSAYPGAQDAFVTVLDFSLFTPEDPGPGVPPVLEYSTYWGGEESEELGGAARFDAGGNLFVGGEVWLTTSGGRGKKKPSPGPDFPLLGVPQIKAGSQDARDGHLAVFAPSSDGFTPVYSSLVGGDEWDAVTAIGPIVDGKVVLGVAASAGLLTSPNALPISGSGSYNPYIMRLASPVGGNQ